METFRDLRRAQKNAAAMMIGRRVAFNKNERMNNSMLAYALKCYVPFLNGIVSSEAPIPQCTVCLQRVCS